MWYQCIPSLLYVMVLVIIVGIQITEEGRRRAVYHCPSVTYCVLTQLLHTPLQQ
jgi:hypothetical protein